MISVKSPRTEEIERWENKTLFNEEKQFLEVLSGNQILESYSLNRVEPYLENLHLAQITAERTGKNRESSDKTAVHDKNYYKQLYGKETDVEFKPLQLQGLDKSLTQVKDTLLEVENSEETALYSIEFGLGLENRNKGINLSSRERTAYEILEDKIGFHIVFSYNADRETEKRYKRYTKKNTGLDPGEGVPGIISIGQKEEPSIYMAGPKDLEFDGRKIKRILGENIEVEGVESLLD